MVSRALFALPLLLATAALSAEPAASPSRVAWVRAALQRIPVSKHDNTPERLERRAEQQEAFAVEIARVSERAPLPQRQWAALIMATGSIESNFDSAVVDGKCLNHQCDPHLVKGQRVFRAVGAFQQQRVAHVEDLWSSTPTIAQQVEMADRSMRRSLGRCKAFVAFPAHVFRAYGGGSCSWPAPREALRVAVYARLVNTAQPKEGGAS